MMYSPLVELIERGLRWVANYGSPLYWVWCTVVGFFGGSALNLMIDQGSWGDTKVLRLVALLAFLVPLPYVAWYEQRWRVRRSARGGGQSARQL